jgi:hypothetical protein
MVIPEALTTGMVLLMNRFKTLAGHMGVDLSGRDISMT